MELFSDSESSDGEKDRVDIVEQYSDDENDTSLQINKEYAKRFQHNKERAELHRLEEQHGQEDDDDSSSDDESEDEEGDQMTADVDAAILSTLAKIRRKDESIYQAGKRIFDEERKNAAESKLLPRRLKIDNDSGKKVTLANYQRARIQELLKTSEDPAKALADATMIERRSDEKPGYDDEEPIIQSHIQEQEQLRKDVTNAFHDIVDGEEEEEFFVKKADGKHLEQDEQGPEDDPENYRKYLLDVLGGKEDEIRDILRSQAEEAAAGDNVQSAKSGTPAPVRERKHISMHEQGNDQENEDFLVNYVLNRGWMDNPQAAPKVTRKGEKKETEKNVDDQSDAETDDSFDSRAEAFETAYNFRFQEMEDGQMNPQIQSYARMIEGSARRQENKRKREREERALRKAQEKEKKRKELDKMRDLKRKSIVDRLKTLKEATGSSAVNFDQLDLNADFDPDEHDKLMAQAFNDDYYGEDGDYEKDDGEKPVWEDDIDISDILREQEQYEEITNPKSAKAKKADKGKNKVKEPKASAFVDENGERIVMDADYVEDANDYNGGDEQSTKKLSKAEKKKLKKREKAKARKADENNEEDEDMIVDADEMDAEIANTKVDKNAVKGEDLTQLSHQERKKKMEEMMNDYYGLEYEDMIGDQPTRFKYTEVAKTDYGLTPVEILLADDAELNKVVSLKNFQPYRMGNSKRAPADLKNRLKDFRRGLYKGKRKEMAEQFGGSLYGNGEGTGANAIKPKKAGKRERERKKAAATAAAAAAASSASSTAALNNDVDDAKVEDKTKRTKKHNRDEDKHPDESSTSVKKPKKDKAEKTSKKEKKKVEV